MQYHKTYRELVHNDIIQYHEKMKHRKVGHDDLQYHEMHSEMSHNDIIKYHEMYGKLYCTVI